MDSDAKRPRELTLQSCPTDYPKSGSKWGVRLKLSFTSVIVGPTAATKPVLVAVLLLLVLTSVASAECIAVPIRKHIEDAEIVMLARVDDVRGTPVAGQPNVIDGTIVSLTVETVSKRSTPHSP